jgi:hypothetical protein
VDDGFTLPVPYIVSPCEVAFLKLKLCFALLEKKETHPPLIYLILPWYLSREWLQLCVVGSKSQWFYPETP